MAGTECNYLKEKVFVHLQPALEETLQKAQIWEALKQQKCFFNGIDHIAQVSFTRNWYSIGYAIIIYLAMNINMTFHILPVHFYYWYKAYMSKQFSFYKYKTVNKHHGTPKMVNFFVN